MTILATFRRVLTVRYKKTVGTLFGQISASYMKADKHNPFSVVATL